MPSQPAASQDVPHPFDDVPQTFLAGDSYDVRGGLVKYISRDLLGPWDGETEALPPRSAGPRDRYLVGMLGPRPESSETATQIARNAAQLADVEPGSDDGKEEGDPRNASHRRPPGGSGPPRWGCRSWCPRRSAP